MKPFVHLHNHTAYSLLDGAARIEDEVLRAKELGMPALAMTDHGVMYGAVEFFKTCKKHGIKPIIGCEVYVAQRTRFDKDSKQDDNAYHLVLLVKNEIGYRNLCRLVTLSSIEGFYYRPRIDKDLLEKYHEGLIAMSACLSGEISKLIMQGDTSTALESVTWYRDVFGEGNYYLEVQNHGLREQMYVNSELRKISDLTGVPLVATNDSHYCNEEDAEVQDVMLCIQTGKILDDPNRMKFDNDQFYIKSYNEMLEALPEYEDALARTVQIADLCHFEFELNVNYMPSFDVPKGYTMKSYLKYLCEKGIIERYTVITEEIQERLDYELNVIDNMGYNAYFLIVWDFIDFARRKNIFVGPGRGSAAGSIVSYALGITNVDPLKYNLLFERFLNPERVNMPDIDIDFCYERRGEVIDYVNEKYGSDHVSQIITFGTMAAKGAIRDVGRVLNIPLVSVNKICKMIPNELGITIEKAVNYSDDLKELIAQDPLIEKLITTAKRLEGLPRHAGMHAAGVVISKEKMDHYLPLQKNADDFIVTQYAKDDVESIGLLKMDFLGLRTLTVLHKTIELVKKRYGIEIDLELLDEKDEQTYAMLSKGDSMAVFQMEGSGLRSVLKDLKPTCLEDLIALVALYRPGPLGSGMIEDFIDRKHGLKDIEYLHPALKEILEPTYGVILYQEQVMQIASRLAGFSLGEADLLRRAMGKKKPEIIAQMREQFQEGCSKNGINEEIAAKIFDLMAYFAGYGFNKSHSAAYGLLAFQTAYLKCHFPKEYMAEILNSFIDNLDKVTLQVAECRRLGIAILPPDVNESGPFFTAVDDGIRFGLSAIKGVGAIAVDSILKERQENGKFRTFQDFCTRVPLGGSLNKRLIESLILSGAFDSLGQGKKALIEIMEECISQGLALKKIQNSNQISLFDISDTKPESLVEEIPLPSCGEFSESENLKLEKEYLGIYITGHPLDGYTKSLNKFVDKSISDLTESMDGKKITLAGLLTSVRLQTTKKGELMAYGDIEDQTDHADILVFPKTLPLVRDMLIENQPVLLKGRFSFEDDNKKIFVESIEELPHNDDIDSDKSGNERKVFLRIKQVDKEDVLSLLIKHPGNLPIYLYIEEDKKYILLHESYWCGDKVIQLLSDKIGANNVIVK